MLCTIITDASFCPDTGAAGFGYYCISNRGQAKGGSAAKVRPFNAHHAELMAMANGLQIALTRGILKENDRLIMQTDCMPAIHMLTNPGTYHNFREPIKIFNDLLFQKNIRVEYRHVKGHTRRDEARFRTQNLCDMHAGRYMREARKAIAAAQTIHDLTERGILP